MSHESLDDRRRALEEAFFAKQDAVLRKKLAEPAELRAKKDAYSAVSGITDEAVLDALAKLDVTPETLAALSLVPLVAVAWADGSIDAKERAAVLRAAGDTGLAAGEWRSSDLPTQQPWILVLEAAATLQVRVTDDRGFFVPGALIEAVVDDKVIRGGRRLAARSRAYTGEDGIARFDDLGDASYDLQFIPFRRWRSADAYGVAAIVGSPGWHELETRSEPDARCLELEVEGLDKLPLERWTRSDLALEVQSDSALLSIFRDGRATLVDQPGRQVHVRMVTVEGGHPLPNGPRSDWRLGIVGQTRALLLEAPQRAQ